MPCWCLIFWFKNHLELPNFRDSGNINHPKSGRETYFLMGLCIFFFLKIGYLDLQIKQQNWFSTSDLMHLPSNYPFIFAMVISRKLFNDMNTLTIFLDRVRARKVCGLMTRIPPITFICVLTYVYHYLRVIFQGKKIH